MRTALLMSGTLRGFQHAYPTWKPFIDQCDDVYYHLAPPSEGETPVKELIWRAKGTYEADVPAMHEWVNPRGTDPNKRYGNGFTPGSALGVQWYAKYKVFQLLEANYDMVAYIRPDCAFMKPLDLSKLDSSKLWTPKTHRWGGVCDYLAVGSEKNVGIWCSLYNHLNDNIHLLPCGNSEDRLAHWLLRNNIELGLINTDFYSVLADGTKRIPPHTEYGEYTYAPYFYRLTGLETR